MLQRIIPAPLLSLALLIVWLLLNHSLSLGHILLGLILGIIIPILTRGLRPSRVRIRKPLTMVRLGFTIVYDTSISNFQVIRFLAFPKLKKNKSKFVHIPLELKDPNALAVLAMITCITPGTAWAEISRDRSILLLHCLEADDPQVIIDHVKIRYERPLMEIFE